MKFYFLLGMFMMWSYASAQYPRKVLDSETGKPISFATVKILHKTGGVVASDSGEFLLAIESTDSVLFSCVGYYEKVLNGSNIGTTVLLAPKIKTLTRVTIGTKEIKRTLVLGTMHKKSKSDMNWGPGPLGLKEEFAQEFQVPDNSRVYRIKTIYIPVEKMICWGTLLLRVYSADSITGLPGESLFLKHLDIQKNEIKDRVAIIHLNDPVFLYDTKCFFVSIGWAPNAYNNKCVTTIILSGESKQITYSRSLSSINYAWYLFGQFKDLKGIPYERNTFYSVELEEMK